MGFGALPLILLMALIQAGLTQDNEVKPVVKVKPDQRVFRGETVTLTCDIQGGGNTEWTYRSFRDGNTVYPYTTPTAELSFTADVSHSGEYSCRGERSDISDAVTLTVSALPTSTVTVTPDRSVFTGETVNLKCVIKTYSDWRYEWYKDSVKLQTSERHTVNTETLTIRGAAESDQGQYWCRGQRYGRPNSSQSRSAVSLSVTDLPTTTVTVTPDRSVFTGETVNLKCVIETYSYWRYEWHKDSVKLQTERYTVNRDTLTIRGAAESDQGQYWCRGQRYGRPNSTQSSFSLSLSVTAEAQAAVRVSPQPWLTEGESATLICEVSGSSTGWTFSWFRDHDHLSDSSRGAGGSYTLSPASLQHTGVYTCRAERGRPAYHTHNSRTQPLWVTGVSASVSLVIKPSRSQHFSSESLALSCEDQSNSAGWTVRRYTDKDTQTCSKQTGSSCVMDSLSTSDTGVYWCESESGEKRRPRNITVHDGEVILSSVDPVIEGETLTLHCLHRSTKRSILSAGFYKDGPLIQNQTTGEMSITTISKSHEGFYYCKTERGASPHSWISVRVSRSAQISGLKILRFLLAACPYLLATVVLLYKCYRARVSSAEDQSQFAVTEEETSI